MIEVEMVRRMMRRAIVVTPFLAGGLLLWGGVDYALSGLVGVVMTIGNLWLSARIIGGVAENNPQLLLPAALTTFALGLALLVGVAFGLKNLDFIDFPVTGFVLIGSHLGLVLWEAAGAYDHADRDAAKVRS